MKRLERTWNYERNTEARGLPGFSQSPELHLRFHPVLHHCWNHPPQKTESLRSGRRKCQSNAQRNGFPRGASRKECRLLTPWFWPRETQTKLVTYKARRSYIFVLWSLWEFVIVAIESYYTKPQERLKEAKLIGGKRGQLFENRLEIWLLKKGNI